MPLTPTKNIMLHISSIVEKTIEDMGVKGPLEINLASPPDNTMGDLGFPCFQFSKTFKKSPAIIAQEIADKIPQDNFIEKVSAVGPYVNFKLSIGVVLSYLKNSLENTHKFGSNQVEFPENILLEYSSPNTNKPQHLGHIRNNLLGQTVGNILNYYGHKVSRVNLINDRGIHICKSMLAYQLFGEDETPESSGLKGDHFVGKYYVRFNKEFEKEWQEHPEFEDENVFFNSSDSSLGCQCRKMLQLWEAQDPEVRALWALMNGWVKGGFQETYARLGINFDLIQYESDTYLLGKDIVEEGVGSGIFTYATNGAIVFDATSVGLDGEKAVLRSDGTSLYITQDLGTALLRINTYKPDRLVYVVGDEQNHHFQILFGILNKMLPHFEGKCHHLSYGMVLLPNGRLKSRKGTAVDADHLLNQMESLAEIEIKKRSPDLNEEEIRLRSEALGKSALKFYLLNASPKNSITFDPTQSLEFTGETGPYLQYAFARTSSILLKGGWDLDLCGNADLSLLVSPLERDFVLHLITWPHVLKQAALQHDPSKVTSFAYLTARLLAKFFSDSNHHVLNAEDGLKEARLVLMWVTRQLLGITFELLGLQALNQM